MMQLSLRGIMKKPMSKWVVEVHLIDDAQCQEIKETGKVRGAEGHHQKNVADHPEDQGDPDNIKFYKSRKEHLEKGHNGDFHNSSDAPKIDKDKMLKKTNSKRVFRNEIKGIGIAAAIGIGVGFTIGFAVSLAQTGVTLIPLSMLSQWR